MRGVMVLTNTMAIEVEVFEDGADIKVKYKYSNETEYKVAPVEHCMIEGEYFKTDQGVEYYLKDFMRLH